MTFYHVITKQLVGRLSGSFDRLLLAKGRSLRRYDRIAIYQEFTVLVPNRNKDTVRAGPANDTVNGRQAIRSVHRRLGR